MAAKYWRINFVLSVFPAPLSPLQNLRFLLVKTFYHIVYFTKARVDTLPNDDTLILSITVHMGVTVVTDGKYVRWKLANFTILVKFDLLGRVDWKYLIGIDSHEDRTGVSLRKKKKKTTKLKNLSSSEFNHNALLMMIMMLIGQLT